MTGLYRPGDSWLHRVPAGPKLLGLAGGLSVLVVVRSVTAVVVGAVVVTALHAAARVPPRVALAQLWPLRWFAVALVPFQWWAGGWRTAVVVVGTMLAAVAAASVVTLTTRVTEMLDALTSVLRPLRRMGTDPDRVALVLALTVRTVPVLASLFADARDARRARGLERSPRALLVPLAVRTLRHADRLGEALAARGVDD